MAGTNSLDFPFDEIVATVTELKAKGGFLAFQKFTCVGCGNRLTMEEPFKFYTEGTCDNCDAVTNIKQQGCNYLLIMEVPNG